MFNTYSVGVGTRKFTASIEPRARGGVAVRLPFDPGSEWGDRDRYDVTGTVGGHKIRGKLIARDGAYYLELGPAWCRDNTMAAGARVSVSLDLEGPQLTNIGADFATALEAEPAARRFFEALPTFYRKNFVRWIEQAKQAETRSKRIKETVETLKAGKRER